MFSRISQAVFVAIFSFVSLGSASPERVQRPPARQDAPPRAEAHFSPRGGCTEAIVGQLNAAKVSVDIQAYSFTSAPIAKAVVDAHRRGVRVRVVLDKSQRTAKYTSATFLANAAVPTFIDAEHAIAHNKIILIDGKVIITGSFNFSKAAETSNAENLLIITGFPDLLKQYETNFSEHFSHAVAYERASGADSARSNPSLQEFDTFVIPQFFVE